MFSCSTIDGSSVVAPKHPEIHVSFLTSCKLPLAIYICWPMHISVITATATKLPNMAPWKFTQFISILRMCKTFNENQNFSCSHLRISWGKEHPQCEQSKSYSSYHSIKTDSHLHDATKPSHNENLQMLKNNSLWRMNIGSNKPEQNWWLHKQ